MNKLKTIIVCMVFTSCYIDDINHETFVVPENFCNCVFYAAEAVPPRWEVVKLQPGTRNVGWLTYSRRDYCDKVLQGSLTCN